MGLTLAGASHANTVQNPLCDPYSFGDLRLGPSLGQRLAIIDLALVERA